jgi:putative (di)nucleoside polyphosphate hydrolase
MNMPEEYFRAGAGAVVINEKGLVLALERADIPGAWQLPQGGLDAGEEPLAAALRETEEETGIPRGEMELLDAYPQPLAYELPPAARSSRNGRGQVQYWFLFRFSGADETIDAISGGEFRAWQWLPFGQLLEGVADFRRPVYRSLAEGFRKHLATG